MNTKKKFGITIICALCAFAIFAGVMFARQYHDAKNSEAAFDELAEMIPEETPAPTPADEPGPSDEPEENPEVQSEEELAREAALAAHEKYAALFEKNSDFIGWIMIDGTNINYPVMQTPNNPDFYLKHSFEKSYSDYGVPYMDEACVTGISNNYVVYGHHMKNGSMFADLCKYGDESFYEEHKTIRFDTLSSMGEYEIVAVFRFNTNHETFRFNEFTQMNEAQFAEFMENVHARQLYDTGVDAEFGDQLLTLSTCEYTYNNGRFVVVAKKV